MPEGFVAVQEKSPDGEAPVYVGPAEEVIDNPAGVRVSVDHGDDRFGAVYRNQDFFAYFDADDVFIPEESVRPGVYRPDEVSKASSFDEGELDVEDLEQLAEYSRDFGRLEKGDYVRMLTVDGEVVEGEVNNAPMAGKFGRVQLEQEPWAYRAKPRDAHRSRDIVAYRQVDRSLEESGEASEAGLEEASEQLEGTATATDGGEKL